jgi:diguanylate cyclase (GGDEF)-like protein
VKALAKVASNSLVTLWSGVTLAVCIVAAIGILGIRSARIEANAIARDELTTSTVTSQLGQDIAAAYSAGERAFLASQAAVRSRLLGSLFSRLLPDIDSELDILQRMHADDPPAEHAGFERFVRQWLALRDLLSPAAAVTSPSASRAARLTTAYQPLATHLGQLIETERTDGQAGEAHAAAGAARAIVLLTIAAACGLAIGGGLLAAGLHRVRRSLEPGQEQAEFADTLQIASGEDEAHLLLQRQLERALPASAAVVLNRNNSADRLEAVTPLPAGSPLTRTLRGAEPHSCLAVRSGRTHCEQAGRAALLSCPVCAACPGASSCVPLTVGGEVIGSVLLNRAAPFTEAENQRIRESVSQAAPVLANLRNLAVAEIRAATDGLTGLPNKRAVTDTLKRMFAQASTTGTALSLLLIDLDHFKRINDQHGHPVGDEVLANVGATLRGALRNWDFAGRNGGEEFTIILPGAGVPAALEVAERVRSAIGEIRLPGAELSVTASVGVAAFPDHASTPERLERLADSALYLAKRQGRNRVEVADNAGTATPATPAETLT